MLSIRLAKLLSIVLVIFGEFGIIVCINSISHVQTNEHRRTVILPMVHDEYVSIYVGNPGTMLLLRYDMYENHTFIFDDTEFRKHSQTFDVLRCINHGSDIFYFGSECVRLPIEIRKPQRYCTKFYDTFWLKYDGVLGLGIMSPIWNHWNSVHITPGRFQLGAEEYFNIAENLPQNSHRSSITDTITYTTTPSTDTIYSSITNSIHYFGESTATTSSTITVNTDTAAKHVDYNSDSNHSDIKYHKERDNDSNIKHLNGKPFKAFAKYVDIQNDKEIHCEILWVTIEPSRETSLLPLKVFKHLFSDYGGHMGTSGMHSSGNHLSGIDVNTHTSDVNRLLIYPINGHYYDIGDSITDCNVSLEGHIIKNTLNNGVFGNRYIDGVLELSASDFESQNFQGKYSRMLCEINMLGDGIILGRTCLHEKKYSYYHHRHSFSINNDHVSELHSSDDDYEGKVELHNFEIGTFRTRLKKDSGSILSGIITILIIGHVLGIIENAIEMGNNLTLTSGPYSKLPAIVILPIYKSTDVYLFLLDSYSLLLGWSCIIYYLLGVGMWHSEWVICLPTIDANTFIKTSNTMAISSIENLLCVEMFRVHILISSISGLFCLFDIILERYPSSFITKRVSTRTSHTLMKTSTSIETISEYINNAGDIPYSRDPNGKSTYSRMNSLINRITTISFLLVVLWIYSTLPAYWTEFILVYSSLCSSLCFTLNLLLFYLFLFNITSLISRNSEATLNLPITDDIGYLPVKIPRRNVVNNNINPEHDSHVTNNHNKVINSRHVKSIQTISITKYDKIIRITKCIIQYIRCAHSVIWITSSAFVQYYMWNIVCNQHFVDSIYFAEILFLITVCIPIGISLNIAIKITTNLNK